MDTEEGAPELRAKRLKILRGMTGLTKKNFSEKHCVSISSMNNWELATSGGLTEKGAKKIVNIMDAENIEATTAWLLYGMGREPRFKEKNDALFEPQPLGATVKLIDNLTEAASQLDNGLRREISLFREMNANALVLSLADDAMEPAYCLGDYIGGIKLEQSDWRKTVGRLCIIETAAQEFYCRKVMRATEINKFDLYTINPNAMSQRPLLPNISVSNLAVITRIWRKPYSKVF